MSLRFSCRYISGCQFLAHCVKLTRPRQGAGVCFTGGLAQCQPIPDTGLEGCQGRTWPSLRDLAIGVLMLLPQKKDWQPPDISRYFLGGGEDLNVISEGTLSSDHPARHVREKTGGTRSVEQRMLLQLPSHVCRVSSRLQQRHRFSPKEHLCPIAVHGFACLDPLV